MSNVGKKIRIEEVKGEPYFYKGDIGLIIKEDNGYLVDFNDNKKVYGNGEWWVGKDNAVFTILKDEVEEQIVFKTQEDVWDYLKSGGLVTLDNNGLYVKIDNGFITAFSKELHKSKGIVQHSFPDPSNWHPYFPPIEKEWYENIPEQGVLCWVKYNCDKEIIRITGTRKDVLGGICFENRNSSIVHQHATPLTEEEVKQYIYKQE